MVERARGRRARWAGGCDGSGGGGAQFLPVLSVREGAQRAVQIPRADGYIAYLTLLNARDGGINGVKLVWEECETVWDVTRTVECYERLKAQGPTGAAVFHPMGTPATYALLERAAHDQIPLLTLGYGRADAADGRVFPYVFNPPTSYWSQNTAKIRFIGQRAGGMAQLKGLKIAHVYHDSEYGRETIPLLDTQAAHYGFTVQHLPVHTAGARPEGDLAAGQGRPARLDHPAHRWRQYPDCPEGSGPGGHPPRQDRGGGGTLHGAGYGTGWGGGDRLHLRQPVWHGAPRPAHSGGTHVCLCRGQGAWAGRDVGTVYWIRGLMHGVLTAEALRTAMRHFGNQPLTGAQVQWGLDHLTHHRSVDQRTGGRGTDATAHPLVPQSRGGRERAVPAVGRHAVARDHRLDRHRSGPGAAPGGGVGSQVCAGERHYATGLPVGAWLLRQRARGAFLQSRAASNYRVQATAYSARSSLAPASSRA